MSASDQRVEYALFPMNAPLIARARFEMLPGEVTGRSRGYLSNVRPNHYIAALGQTVIGIVDFDGGSIELGETKEAVISYVYFEPLVRLLVPGLRYEVREGNRLVGFVEIVEVDRGDRSQKAR